MGEVEGRPDPWQMRVSDADRDKVADILRRAAGEGRLRLDELDERLSATYEARTYADLVPITVDLPAHDEADRPVPGTAPAPRPDATPAVAHASSWAVMGDCKRRGHWSLPAQHTAFSLMGSVLLDLREATFESSTTTIHANAVMGDVKVLVDARTHVVVDGVPVMGDFKQSRDRVPAAFDQASPTVHVKGLALMGSVSVVRLPPPGTPRRYLGHY